jgi:hypothetical protein
MSNASKTTVTTHLFWTRSTAALFAILTFIYFASHRELVSCNDGSQFALARAMGEEFRFSINSFMQYTQRVDFSFFNGNFLSDRPPGTSLLVAPLIAICTQLSILAGRFDPISLELVAVYCCYLTLALSAALASVTFLNVLFALGISRRAAWVTTIIFSLASLHWKYATIFMSHGPAETVVLLICWYCLNTFSKEPNHTSSKRNASAYTLCFLLGLLPVMRLEGVIFSALFGAVILAGLVIKKISSPLVTKKQIALALLLAATPLLFLSWYHTVCFGAPWHTFASYYHPDRNFWGELSSFTAIGGQFGTSEFMGHPILSGIVKVLFQFPGHPELLIPAKIGGLGAWGIVILQPILLLAPFGLITLFKSNKLLSTASLLGVLGMLLFCAASKALDGGAMRDPRYIQPILPICFMLIAPVIDWWQRPSQPEWLTTGCWILCSALAYAGFWMCFIHIAESDGSYYSFREAIDPTSIYESIISKEFLSTILFKVFVAPESILSLITVLIVLSYSSYFLFLLDSKISSVAKVFLLCYVNLFFIYKIIAVSFDHSRTRTIYPDTLQVAGIPVTRAVQEKDWASYATFTGAVQAPISLIATTQPFRRTDLAHMTTDPLITHAKRVEVASRFPKTPCTQALIVKTRSQVTVPLNGLYSSFKVRVGRSSALPYKEGSVLHFEIWGDGKRLFSSRAQTILSSPETASISINQIKTLDLVAFSEREGDFQYGVWCDASLS